MQVKKAGTDFLLQMLTCDMTGPMHPPIVVTAIAASRAESSIKTLANMAGRGCEGDWELITERVRISCLITNAEKSFH